MWAIEMSRRGTKDRERFVNTVVLWGLLGLVMALAVATGIAYEGSASDHPQPGGTPEDRGQPRPAADRERPHE